MDVYGEDTGGLMTYEEFLEIAIYAKGLHSEWRMGQTIFNTLWEYRRDLANSIHGTGYDPFFREVSIDVCLDFLRRNWDVSESKMD